MFIFLTADQNMAFTFALALMLLIALLEIIGMMFGGGVSQFFDSLLPDMDFDVDLDIDVDADIDIDGNADADVEAAAVQMPVLSSLLGWFRLGQVPVLILLVIFLTCFGLLGLCLQSIADTLMGAMLPTMIAAPLAFAATLPCYRVTSGLVARIAPKDETSAVSDTTFIGRTATITLGTAAQNSPAEAKLTDKFQQTHYIMVVPDLDDATFVQGEQVLIIRKSGSLFRVIASDNPVLNEP